MSKTMVVQFMPDGTIAHTRDKDFDLASMLGAKRSIQRMTDIIFDEDHQKFYIKFLRGVHPGVGSLAELFVVAKTLRRAELAVYDSGASEQWPIKFFDTYEDAVQYEIELVNELRLAGCQF